MYDIDTLEIPADAEGATGGIVTLQSEEYHIQYLVPPITWRQWVEQFVSSLKVTFKASQSGGFRLARFGLRIISYGYPFPNGYKFSIPFDFLYIEEVTGGNESTSIADKTYDLGRVFKDYASDGASQFKNEEIADWFMERPDQEFLPIQVELESYSGAERGAGQFVFMAPAAWVPSFDFVSLGIDLVNDKHYAGKSGASFSVDNISFQGNATLDADESSIEFLGESVPIDDTLTVSPIEQIGTLTATAKVVDSRGRATTKTLSIISYSHTGPSVTRFSAQRCDENGSENPNGQHAKVRFDASAVSDLNSHVVSFVSLRWRDYLTDEWSEPIDVTSHNGSDFIVQDATFDLDTQYEMMLEVTDDSGQKTIAVSMMFKAFLTMDFLAGGHGMAIGGPATGPGFKCYMDAGFDGNVTMGGPFTESELKCYMDTKFLGSVDVGNENINISNLSQDAKNRIFPTPRHNNTYWGDSGYIKIKITKKTDWMLSFTLNVYGGYTAYGIRFSGYNYDYTGTWHEPKASVIYAMDNCPDIQVWFGHDGYQDLWVAVPYKAYIGLSITDVVRGYRLLEGDVPDKELFEISNVDSLSGTIDWSTTLAGPLWKRMYPIGALYISYSSTSPASLFGGSWVQITNRYLRAANENNTGGADSETINFDHTHAQRHVMKGPWDYNNGYKYTEGESVSQMIVADNRSSWYGIGNADWGEKVPLSNVTISRIVSYQNVYVWRRTG